MQMFIKTLQTCIFILFLTATCHSLSFAGDIQITSKGLYYLTPSHSISMSYDNIKPLKKHSLLKNTTEVEAALGTSFGFEFILNGTSSVSTTIKMVHPRIPNKEGKGYTTINSIPLLLEPNNTYFVGWDFSNKDELQSGEWSFEFDFPDTEIVKFNVTAPEQIESAPKAQETPLLEYELRTIIKPNPEKAEKTFPQYIVRGGIFTSAEIAEKNAQNVQKRGFDSFVFVREDIKSDYKYYVIIKIFDSKKDADGFAADYRNKYRRQAITEKLEVKTPLPRPTLQSTN
ncbi:DUF3859 domain-containing protein [Maridesulfovibrio frigidus]|nr:DUF3859 domain-containing protein [Maridesulfovibrio frigidus]